MYIFSVLLSRSTFVCCLPLSNSLTVFSVFEVMPGNAMFKYADDTYIVIPARNTQSMGSELDNVSKWALANNLRLNKAKCVEIVFTDSRRKLQICQPPTIPDIQRVTSVSSLYWALLPLTACLSVSM